MCMEFYLIIYTFPQINLVHTEWACWFYMYMYLHRKIQDATTVTVHKSYNVHKTTCACFQLKLIYKLYTYEIDIHVVLTYLYSKLPIIRTLLEQNEVVWLLSWSHFRLSALSFILDQLARSRVITIQRL